MDFNKDGMLQVIAINILEQISKNHKLEFWKWELRTNYKPISSIYPLN